MLTSDHMNKRSTLEIMLHTHQTQIGSLLSGLVDRPLVWLDFTEHNPLLQQINLKDTAAFDRWLFGEVLRGKVGIGGFMEERVIYQRSAHYAGAEARSVHLGIDLWTAAGTPVFAPWSGIVHSFNDNQGFGNYGPTIILQHTLADRSFYTLYGHLSRRSLTHLSVGRVIAKNERVGEIGQYPENGDWPPHLHFQGMTDLLGWVGDFPGVVAPSERAKYAEICINPEYLLRIGNGSVATDAISG